MCFFVSALLLQICSGFAVDKSCFILRGYESDSDIVCDWQHGSSSLGFFEVRSRFQAGHIQDIFHFQCEIDVVIDTWRNKLFIHNSGDKCGSLEFALEQQSKKVQGYLLRCINFTWYLWFTGTCFVDI